MIDMRVLALSLLMTLSLSAESLVQLEAVSVQPLNTPKVLRGAEHFKQSCMSCHSLKYWRYDDVAKQAQIRLEDMPTWPLDSWGGHPPPDLSLIALEMGPKWIYTYLHAYVSDSSRPTGFNNLVYPNTNMPNPFVDMQGVNRLKPEYDIHTLHLLDKPHWYQVVDFGRAGSMTAQQFDLYVEDLVTFLTYVSDPSIAQRAALGPWVVGYLLLALACSMWVFMRMQKK